MIFFKLYKVIVCLAEVSANRYFQTALSPPDFFMDVAQLRNASVFSDHAGNQYLARPEEVLVLASGTMFPAS